MNQTEISLKIAENLLSKGAVKVSVKTPFTWASGIKSPVYCDNRKIISYTRERKFVVEAFKALIELKDLRPDVIGGTATAAIPWAAFLAYEMDLPLIYIRPEPKAHGAGKQVEGDVEAGKRVLIVEDLVSTGGSSVKASEAVRKETGAVVEDVLAIVNWDLPGVGETFIQASLNLRFLTDFRMIVEVAEKSGRISFEELQIVKKFRENPQVWFENLV